MSKKRQIIEMVNGAIKDDDGSFTLTGTTIQRNGFYQGYDGGDIKYIMKVINSLGYKCRCGLALHCFPKTIQILQRTTAEVCN